ncbi:RNA polymerase sigma factor [Microvirga rosea]|uniref:RNA polymerase sigma factor n=1 Tax=Microvirga rosea TaxID=2715425 RepID=UPI001D0A560C|nr:sigma-70 family RNA polymerase sigma factor [Microvirga rosea]MCB8822826.1 sigma-70 family RNA polymerase sigma factor [Microvirga rosea]
MTVFSSPLVHSAIAGDHAALLKLLETAQPDIRRYARSTCRAADVDDAVQETLWVLYRRVGTLRAAASFSAWLFAVVRRECLRLTRNLGLISSDGVADEKAVLVQSDAELRLDIAKAIQSLPEHYRVIVLMRDVEQRTINEIGHALGETREAVKARLHRARILLREYLLQ